MEKGKRFAALLRRCVAAVLLRSRAAERRIARLRAPLSGAASSAPALLSSQWAPHTHTQDAAALLEARLLLLCPAKL